MDFLNFPIFLSRLAKTYYSNECRLNQLQSNISKTYFVIFLLKKFCQNSKSSSRTILFTSLKTFTIKFSYNSEMFLFNFRHTYSQNNQIKRLLEIHRLTEKKIVTRLLYTHISISFYLILKDCNPFLLKQRFHF